MKHVSIHEPKNVIMNYVQIHMYTNKSHAIFSRVITKLDIGKISGNKTERTIGQLIV